MPTKDEFQELLDNTTAEWTENYSDSGVAGCKLVSKTDASKYIFMPAAGNGGGSSLYQFGSHGNYWSSSVGGNIYRWSLSFSLEGQSVNIYGNCYYGYSVRGVCE